MSYGLATSCSRDQLRSAILAFLFCANFIFSTTHAQSGRIILSVLAPLGMVDAIAIREFEQKRHVNVRMELVGGPSEYEPRLRNSPRGWDVVLADESQLIRLVYSKLLRPLPESVSKNASHVGLDIRPKVNEDGRAYLNLMADPMGLVWKQDSLSSKNDPAWTWLSQMSENPYWRNRTLLPYDMKVQFLIAKKATSIVKDTDMSIVEIGSSVANDTVASAALAFDWLKQARLQARPHHAQMELDFLSDRVVAGILWRSDFLRIRKLVRNIEFEVPRSGTYFTRIGAAIVADTAQEILANEFVQFLYLKRDSLARYAGLVSLAETKFEDKPIRNWSLLENDLVLPKAIEQELTRQIMSGD